MSFTHPTINLLRHLYKSDGKVVRVGKRYRFESGDGSQTFPVHPSIIWTLEGMELLKGRHYHPPYLSGLPAKATLRLSKLAIQLIEIGQ